MAYKMKYKSPMVKHCFKMVDESPVKKKKMKNPCWKGYKAYGTKKKNGKTVPNCVPKKKK